MSLRPCWTAHISGGAPLLVGHVHIGPGSQLALDGGEGAALHDLQQRHLRFTQQIPNWGAAETRSLGAACQPTEMPSRRDVHAAKGIPACSCQLVGIQRGPRVLAKWAQLGLHHAPFGGALHGLTRPPGLIVTTAMLDLPTAPLKFTSPLSGNSTDLDLSACVRSAAQVQVHAPRLCIADRREMDFITVRSLSPWRATQTWGFRRSVSPLRPPGFTCLQKIIAVSANVRTLQSQV